MPEMISLEEARALVLSHAAPLPVETVPVLDAVGRVAAADLKSDIDISPFAHSAMDGFAVRAAELVEASQEAPVELDVVAEIAAGDVFEGSIEAGEEAKAGETVVSKGEVIGSAGVGFLAGCGIVEVPTHRRPRVAIISIGSELVDPAVVPTPGKIRNSNSYALAACAQAAGAAPVILPIVEDTKEALAAAVSAAADAYDFVVTSGGASNGDFDFIKPVVSELGELLMTTVNIRPGKAQTFGVVRGTPVFGLPGNPAAAYVGFEMIIRPALRKMQGYAHFERPSVMAKLSRDVKKKDPRRIFLRGTLYKNDEGEYVVAPAKNQSSGLFGVIQRSNCMAILPEGLDSRTAGSLVQCVLLDVSEEVSL